MSELPSGWAKTVLGEIAETRLGKMLSAKARTGEGSRPYLRNKNVQWGRIDLDDVLEMDFTGDELDRFRVSPGDLLVCEGGEVGRAAIWRGRIDWIGYQKALHRVRPAGGIAPEYVLYAFMWLAQTNAFDRHVTGSTIKHLPQEDLRLLGLPLPPLNEHRRVVAAIEEHLSRLDAADASLAAALARAQPLRNQILMLALNGSWPSAAVGAVADVISGPAFKSSEFRGPGEGIRLLRGENIEPGALRWRDTRTWPESMLDGYEHLIVTDTDLILAMDRPVISSGLKLAPVRKDDVPALLVQRVARIRPGERVLTGFLHAALRLPRFIPHVIGDQTGTQLPHITLAGIRAFQIPLPPLEEQRRIVAEVEERLGAIDALRAAIERAQRRGTALRRLILERAFRGELVPQDPSDEPASALLDRIRSERDAQPAHTGRRRVRE